ncbi:outer membrane protein assembly factor BamA [Candidatus Pseudothioglobus sp. Uisw_016]|uniref:outer membrane protein assembly factor BamA n=1 Tax=Candidatus Pseudothioglobus sp. Uisw_016 TaxID=3230995 RepID=UPI003A876D64
MKNKLTKYSFLLFLFFTTQVFANPINKINFVGLNNTSESTLLTLIPFKVGQNFLPTTSDQIIRSLFETGLFENISIIKNENTLEISLKENPIIKYLKIELNSGSGFSNWLNGEKTHLTPEFLSQLQEENQLSIGQTYTNRKLDDFELLIESKYSDSGYFKSQITKRVTIDDQNRAGIELGITQGARAKIELFTITGNNNFTEKDLLKNFKIGEADIALVNYFTNKDDFLQSEFLKGIDLITNKYFDSGYLDFKIINVDTILNDNNENISINIEISEGIQYKLGNLSYDGELGNLSLDDLNNAISLNEGEIFNRNSVIQSIQILTDLFADQGYAFVEINPITSEFLDSVNINFTVSLNQKTYINRITISGNTRTQDEVIRREIGISEGGLYSRSILRKSLLKLRRIGYFSDVQISTSEVDGFKDKININFLVEETQTGAVSFSMSHSNNYGVAFGAGIEEKNIFGSGNTLNADLKVSESFNKISFYFMNPNFNDEGHSISLGAFRSEINDDDIAKNSYEINSTGFNLGYGIPLNDETRLNTGIEYSKNEIKCSSLFSGTGYESSQCASKNSDEFKLTVNWSQNTLNNFMYPTEGVNNSLNAGIALPLGDYRYFNISADHTSYAPISSSTTLKLLGNLNLSKGYSSKQLPFYKRHFGGGSGSVRGFGNKTLGPLYPNGKAKGGELSILASANLITPAFFFENNEKMRMSAFIDAGNIYEKSSNIKLGDLRMSAGFGFAYLSPIGSIGAYISTPIIKKSDDTIESFGFSLGSGF